MLVNGSAAAYSVVTVRPLAAPLVHAQHVRTVTDRVVAGIERRAARAAQQYYGVLKTAKPGSVTSAIAVLRSLEHLGYEEVDAALHGYVEQAIRHLSPDPRHSVVWVRSIVDRSLDLIWQKELKDHLYRSETLAIWRCAKLKARSAAWALSGCSTAWL